MEPAKEPSHSNQTGSRFREEYYTLLTNFVDRGREVDVTAFSFLLEDYLEGGHNEPKILLSRLLDFPQNLQNMHNLGSAFLRNYGANPHLNIWTRQRLAALDLVPTRYEVALLLVPEIVRFVRALPEELNTQLHRLLPSVRGTDNHYIEVRAAASLRERPEWPAYRIEAQGLILSALENSSIDRLSRVVLSELFCDLTDDIIPLPIERLSSLSRGITSSFSSFPPPGHDKWSEEEHTYFREVIPVIRKLAQKNELHALEMLRTIVTRGYLQRSPYEVSSEGLYGSRARVNRVVVRSSLDISPAEMKDLTDSLVARSSTRRLGVIEQLANNSPEESTGLLGSLVHDRTELVACKAAEALGGMLVRERERSLLDTISRPLQSGLLSPSVRVREICFRHLAALQDLQHATSLIMDGLLQPFERMSSRYIEQQIVVSDARILACGIDNIGDIIEELQSRPYSAGASALIVGLKHSSHRSTQSAVIDVLLEMLPDVPDLVLPALHEALPRLSSQQRGHIALHLGRHPEVREASVSLLNRLSQQGTEVSTKALLAWAQISPADSELHRRLRIRARRGDVQRVQGVLDVCRAVSDIPYEVKTSVAVEILNRRRWPFAWVMGRMDEVREVWEQARGMLREKL